MSQEGEGGVVTNAAIQYPARAGARPGAERPSRHAGVAIFSIAGRGVPYRYYQYHRSERTFDPGGTTRPGASDPLALLGLLRAEVLPPHPGGPRAFDRVQTSAGQ